MHRYCTSQADRSASSLSEHVAKALYRQRAHDSSTKHRESCVGGADVFGTMLPSFSVVEASAITVGVSTAAASDVSIEFE